MELKSIIASVFFSSDVANPDTYRQFYCDMQMYTTTMSAPDPEDLHASVRAPGRSRRRRTNGRAATCTRWRNDEYDKAFKAPQAELDPVKRAALFIAMNDLVVGDPGVIPVVYRPRVSGCRNASCRCR